MRIFALLFALGLSLTAAADDHPSYQNGILTLPRVDTPAQVGKYRDASLRLEQDGTWRLEAVRSLQEDGNGGLVSLPIETVEVIQTESFPVGVYLRTAGWVWPCGYEGKTAVHQQLNSGQFKISISVPHLISNEPYLCAAVSHYIRLTIPLNVYGLSAGTYTYDVNGISGSFTLTSDNRFSNDCSNAPTLHYCP